MIKRKLTLEQRVSKLENIINKYSRMKFESDMMTREEFMYLFKLVQDACDRSGDVEALSESSYNKNGVWEFSIADIVEGEYCDDWECNWWDVSVYKTPDGRIKVDVNGLGNDWTIGTFNTIEDAARAILKDRGV